MTPVGGVVWRVFRHDDKLLNQGQDFPFYTESGVSGQAVYRYWALWWSLQPGTYLVVLGWWYENGNYKRLAGYHYAA